MAVELKDPAEYASTGSLTPTKVEALKLEGTATLYVDGGVPEIGDRTLLKDQEAAAQNGLWELKTAKVFGGEGTFGESGNFGEGEGWSFERPADADTDAEINKGMMVQVEEGEINGKTTWLLVTNDPVTVGTTDLEFVPLWASAKRGVSNTFN